MIFRDSHGFCLEAVDPKNSGVRDLRKSSALLTFGNFRRFFVFVTFIGELSWNSYFFVALGEL